VRAIDVVGDAVANTFRAKTRTTLTIVAIVIGAFTLTITTGLGTGINQYISTTVAQAGASDVMTVTHTIEQSTDDGPTEYDPDQVDQGQTAGPPGTTQSVDPITEADLDTIAAVDGVLSVGPVKRISVDFIQAGDGTPFEIGVGSFVPGMQVILAAGEQPDSESSERQVVIPQDYVESLGFSDADAAIGQEVTFGLTDADRVEQSVTATIVGVSEPGLIDGGASATPNAALTDALYSTQQAGVESDSFSSATVRFDPDATPTDIDALKGALADAGFTGTTIDDTLGAFTAVIDAIVLVLNAFAVIALLAAGFGIVNTLLMSVQERTREIGLMKAMGMGSGKVFGLFSVEATYIGFLGSAIGVGVGMLAGTAVAGALARGLFADLPGLTLIAFDPVSVGTIILLVMAIAFLAGTVPAARAARQDPISSLRYE
jgi:putative ABC transport system permease protein